MCLTDWDRFDWFWLSHHSLAHNKNTKTPANPAKSDLTERATKQANASEQVAKQATRKATKQNQATNPTNCFVN